MKNEEENREKQQANTGATTPPPFRPNEEPQEMQEQEPPASPTLAERINALGLDEETNRRLTALTDGMAGAAASDDLLATLVRGITHDADVENADAEGYLRGRNEKIETVLPPERDAMGDEPESTPVFPQYCRRSIWD